LYFKEIVEFSVSVH